MATETIAIPRELLCELILDLEAEIRQRYSGIENQPSAKRRMDRDMHPIIEARKYLYATNPQRSDAT